MIRRGVRSEAGFALIEVMVATMMLVLVATGLFAALDAAGHTSGTNRARSLASLLAQQDQERLRSFLPNQLSALNQTRTQTAGGITFTITSTGTWLNDKNGGAPDCNANSNSADYIKISSKVTWPNMVVQPVQVDSLVSPPSGSLDPTLGNLAVQVVDRNGNGVPGLSLAISGPQSSSKTTDANGCATWLFIPQGNYALSFQRAGWIDPNGNNAINTSVGVTPAATSSNVFQYDQAGAINVSFDTLPLGAAQPIASKGDSISIDHPSLTTPRVIKPGGLVSSVGVNNVFPFTSPYAIYAGDCKGADPRVSPNAGAAASVTVGPGGSTNVTVRQPAINVLVTDKNGNPINGATVTFTPTLSGCGTMETRTTNASGKLPDPGLPYGNYTVCATSGNRKVTQSVQNNTAAGTSLVSLQIKSNSPNGTCP